LFGGPVTFLPVENKEKMLWVGGCNAVFYSDMIISKLRKNKRFSIPFLICPCGEESCHSVELMVVGTRPFKIQFCEASGLTKRKLSKPLFVQKKDVIGQFQAFSEKILNAVKKKGLEKQLKKELKARKEWAKTTKYKYWSRFEN
jgi:hypothetical protein